MDNKIRYQVFISSTFVDLEVERRKIAEALLALDCIPAGMELFPAADEEQFKYIKKIIDDCDYYIVVVGGRYGSLADDGVSFTEKEYRYARERGKPVLVFLHAAPNDIPMGNSEHSMDGRRRLQMFREELQSNRLVANWRSAEELVSQVILAITKAKSLQPQLGWVRGGTSSSVEILSELNSANRRIKELESVVAQGSVPSRRPIGRFPILTISYFRTDGTSSKPFQVGLDTLLLAIGSAIATDTLDYQFQNLIGKIVRRAERLSCDVEVDAADVMRVRTLLYAWDLVVITEYTNNSFESSQLLRLSSKGKEVLAELLDSSVEAMVSKEQELEAVWGLKYHG